MTPPTVPKWTEAQRAMFREQLEKQWREYCRRPPIDVGCLRWLLFGGDDDDPAPPDPDDGERLKKAA